MIHHHHQQEQPVADEEDGHKNKLSSTQQQQQMAASTSDHGYLGGGFTSSSSSVIISPHGGSSSSNSGNPFNPSSQIQYQYSSSSSGFHNNEHPRRLGVGVGPSEIYNLATGVEMIAFHNPTSTSTSTPSKTLLLPADKPSALRMMTAPSDLMAAGNGALLSYPPAAVHHKSTSSSSYHHHPMLITPPESSTWQRNITTLDSPSSSSSSASQRYALPNTRPRQGLSLSLNSNNNLRLQSFDLMNQANNNHSTPDSRGGFTPSIHHQPPNLQHQQQQDAVLQSELLKSSKYMTCAQELLSEFCCLGTKQLIISNQAEEGDDSDDDDDDPRKHKKKTSNNNNNNDASCSTGGKSSDLCALGMAELQKRKKRLLFMLDELDRRYKHYHNQMKTIVSSFESVAGEGAAAVYTALASKAMSRHFRSLRDGIVNQIKAHKKAVMDISSTSGGDGSSSSSLNMCSVPETTPRLRMLDQALRQEKALQQLSLMESHPWRPQRGLPERAVSVLRAWLFEHFLHPYPSDVDKHILARQTGLTRSQVSNWFINARVRLWKPMVEEMYVEEVKEDQPDQDCSNLLEASSSTSSAMAATRDHHAIHNYDHHHHHNHLFNSNNIPQYNPSMRPDEQKPTQDQLLRVIDPAADQNESLASIVNHNSSHRTHFDRITHSGRSGYIKNPSHHQPDQGFTTGFGSGTSGSMDHLDLLSYQNVSNVVDLVHTNFGLSGGPAGAGEPSPMEGGGGGHVSLTLGLHQNGDKVGGGGVSLAYPPPGQGSFFYNRDVSDHHQQLDEGEDGIGSQQQYNSLLDDAAAAQGQSNLPYRNLLGAQFLHDFGS